MATDGDDGGGDALSMILGGTQMLSEQFPGFSANRRCSDVELLASAAKVFLYFFLLFLTWGHSIRDLVRIGWPRFTITSLLLLGLGLYNVVEAWSLIFSWLQDEYMEAKLNAGPRFAWEDWFVEMDLFKKAYEMVVTTYFQWFWSSQLLHFVSGLVLFTYVEFYRCDAIRPLSNFWLGCAAAISLSFPYAMYVAINMRVPFRRERWFVPVNPVITISLLVANVAVILLPRVDASAFDWILAAIHGSLCLPLLISQFAPSALFHPVRTQMDRRMGSWWIPVCYGILAGIAGTVQLMNILTAAATYTSPDGDVLTAFFDAFCANPSQCSISNDVARTTIIFMIVVLFAGGHETVGGLGWKSRLVLVVASPIVSVGVTFPIWAAYREVKLRMQPFTYEERARRMFQKYHPDKNPNDIETIVSALQYGDQEELIQRIVALYGPEPNEFVITPRRVAQRVAVAPPAAPPAARPAPAPPAVPGAPGAPPAPRPGAALPPMSKEAADALRVRLKEFYRVHNPAMADDEERLNMIITTWAGRTDYLFVALRDKYNVPTSEDEGEEEKQQQQQPQQQQEQQQQVVAAQQ